MTQRARQRVAGLALAASLAASLAGCRHRPSDAAAEARAGRGPGDPARQLQLGARYLNEGAYGPAEEALYACLADEPNNARAHYYLGIVLRRRGRMESRQGRAGLGSGS